MLQTGRMLWSQRIALPMMITWLFLMPMHGRLARTQSGLIKVSLDSGLTRFLMTVSARARCEFLFTLPRSSKLIKRVIVWFLLTAFRLRLLNYLKLVAMRIQILPYWTGETANCSAKMEPKYGV